ncbi:leucine-rich repeat domain-containing protein [Flavobacterium sp. J27]|uniref:leucine-rich repeat domain-containing protein n=1 Tax=Flavobacterium sp. J27 TaxID=2060419 RepID=UPI00102F4274|nr:leucine-rich repeat domain-containing protein [Flavobacterium sp. J27]
MKLLMLLLSNFVFGQLTITSLDSSEIDIILDSKKNIEIEHQIMNMDINESLKVKQIIIRGNFDHIPSFIFIFSNTEEIEIHSTKKISLSNEFNSFTNLRSIRVISDVIDISDMLILEKVEFLSIKMPNSKTFPEVIFKWKNLIEIDIQEGDFFEIPSEIINLINLRRINLSNNGIGKLPDQIGLLENIEVLSLNKNCLTSLPNSICNLKK